MTEWMKTLAWAASIVIATGTILSGIFNLAVWPKVNALAEEAAKKTVAEDIIDLKNSIDELKPLGTQQAIQQEQLRLTREEVKQLRIEQREDFDRLIRAMNNARGN